MTQRWFQSKSAVLISRSLEIATFRLLLCPHVAGVFQGVPSEGGTPDDCVFTAPGGVFDVGGTDVCCSRKTFSSSVILRSCSATILFSIAISAAASCKQYRAARSSNSRMQ